MNTEHHSRPALVILATYTENGTGMRAEVMQQASRYLMRLVDEDAGEIVGLRSYTTQAAADAYARKCTGQ